MAATSPLTADPRPDVASRSPLTDPAAEKKPDPAQSDAASAETVKRVRAAIGSGGQKTEIPPSSGDAPKFPEMQPLPPPPKREDTPPIEAWGSLAMLAAALGGALSRNHATTALNAAGAALQGIHQRDEEKFKDEMERWKIATDNTQRMQSYEVETYKAIMAQRAQTFNEFLKLDRDKQQEMMVELHANTVAQGNDRLAWLIEHQHNEEVFKQLEAQRKATEAAEKQRDKIQSAYTMESAWAKAVTAGDTEAKDDPNGWKWKRFPEAAGKAGLPKPGEKSEESEDTRGWWEKYAPTRLGGKPAPGAATQPATPAPPASSPEYTSGGKHYRYSGTGDYDDAKNWEVTPVQ